MKGYIRIKDRVPRTSLGPTYSLLVVKVRCLVLVLCRTLNKEEVRSSLVSK